METKTDNAHLEKLYPKGFDLDMYREWLRSYSCGIATEPPAGGVRLIGKRLGRLARFAGTYLPRREMILINMYRISNIIEAGGVLAHETRHHVDHKLDHLSVRRFPPYRFGYALAAGGKSIAALKVAQGSVTSGVELLGFETGSFHPLTPGSFAVMAAIGGLSVGLGKLSDRAYESSDNEFEERARIDQVTWGETMANTVLRDVDLDFTEM